LHCISLRDVRAIEQAVVETLQAIESEKVVIDTTESKKTSGGYLAILSFQSGEHVATIQMEISLREGGKKGEVVTIASDYIPSFTVVALVREQLVAEKIQALLTRKKARDLYDLYFILRANLLSARDKAVLAKALPVLKQSRINFERELKEFLPKSHWAILRDFPTTLEREMQRFL
jgi:predicted nucleotidyltransferase component of viral defense system